MPETELALLLVEDNPGDAELLSELIADVRGERFRVRHVSTLAAALRAVGETQFDAVLLDLGLPDAGPGLEVLRTFRAADQNLPVVVLTGLADDAVTRQVLRDGAQDYLIKGQCDGPCVIRAVRYAIERMAAVVQLKKTEEQLRQAQRLEAIGRLAGGVAHDINNMMTVVTGYCDLLHARLPDRPELRDMLDEVNAAGHRAARVTRQLLAFSRKQLVQPTILDPNAVVRGMERMLRRLIREDVDLTFALAPDARTIRADSGQLEQVVLNLALNARDAMPQGGKLTIETANVLLGGDYWPSGFAGQPGRYVMLAVSDTGTGMDEKTQKHIFEPFFTTKAAGLGTGLGLATVYGIVKQFEGQIAVYSEPGRGTTFRVYLPAVGGPVTPAPLAQAPIDLRGKETVLFAEDDVAIRMLARQILDSHGYHVLTARNGREALKVCTDYSGAIDLLITDTVMPELNGRQLSQALSTARPATKVLFVSGYTENVIVHHGLLEPGINFLPKPFSAEGLLRRVREILGRP